MPLHNGKIFGDGLGGYFLLIHREGLGCEAYLID